MTSSHIVLTEPVPDVIEELGWTGGECITDGRTLVHYFRTTRDGRIVLGWGGGRLAYGARLNGRVEVDAEVARRDAARRSSGCSPASRGRRVTHAWGGPIDVSPSHIPQVGTLPGAPVHFAFGYTGNGVGPSQPGRAHAGLARPRTAATSSPACRSSTPTPARGCRRSRSRWLGGSVVRSALVRGEHAEERGERADPLTRAVCAAPRALGMHLAR